MPTLRLTLAQINPTIGDIQHNLACMQRAAQQAAAQAAHMVIFPELALTAYPPGDLLNEPTFLKRIDQGITQLLGISRTLPNLYWVVGTPTPAQKPGKRLHNSLLVIANGEIVLSYAKQLLPTYDIFNEDRYFEPGPNTLPLLRIQDVSIAFMICEDAWNDAENAYPINPLAQLAQAKPDLVISINASPSSIGKREQRHTLLTAASARYQLPLVYVNQIGGHDQLIFDGASFAVTPQQGVVFEARRFIEDVTTLEFCATPGAQQFLAHDRMSLASVDAAGLPMPEFMRQQIKLGLRDYVRRCGFTKVIVGSSGGIDSALTLALAAEALGAENVVALTMPSAISSIGSVNDSIDLCQRLGIQLYQHPIIDLVEKYYEKFLQAFGTPLTGVAFENLQARIRGTILMEYSNAFGHLLLTTGNKSELSVGYCTLYGDTNGGLGLLGDLYKTEVFALSRYLNEVAQRIVIPLEIIEKEPSAELAPGQRDSDSLPPYPVLDTVLKHLLESDALNQEERIAVDAYIQALANTEEGRALIVRIKKMLTRSEYKRRQAPPILRLRSHAFGSGRQMPIAAHYE